MIFQDAEISTIKKAYRRLSMEWHPDRNSDEEAEDQFRKVSILFYLAYVLFFNLSFI